MPDFETMPVGTRAALEDTAKLLRSYEQHHRERARSWDEMGGPASKDVRGAAREDCVAKAERNAGAAASLEALLDQCGVAWKPSPPCQHPRDKCTPVMGKICTYECDECGVEFTRTRSQHDEAPELVTPNTGVAPEVRPMKLEEKETLHMLATVAQQTFGPWRQHMLDVAAQPNADMLLAAAVATFAGCVVGETVAVGALPEMSVPRSLDTLRKNMEAGVEIGRKHVARVTEQVLAEGQEGGKQ